MLFKIGFIGDIRESISGDESGSRWRVRIINAGRSQNGNDYPLDVLHNSISVFEGVKVLSRSEADHIADRNVSAENTVGWIEGVTAVAEGLEGTLVFTDDVRANDLKSKIRSAFQAGKTDLIGLSIVADAIAHTKHVAGKISRVVEKITRARSVDVIVNPSAGGRFLMAVAGGNPELEGNSIMNLEKLLKLIEAHDPEGFKRIDQKNIDESLVVELAAKVAESMAAKAADLTVRLAEATKAPATGTPDNLAELRESLREVTNAVKSLKESTESKAVARLDAMEFERVFGEICTESRLPDEAVDHALNRIPLADRKAANRDKITEAVKAERAYFYKRAGFEGQRSLIAEAEVTADAGEKFVAALTGLFTGRNEPFDVKRPNDTVPRATSIREAYINFTGDTQITGLMKNAPFVPHLYETGATLNAQWNYALGDSITRALMAEYRLPSLMEWEKIVTKVPVRDFRTQRRIQMGGFPTLATVSASGSYAIMTDIPDDFEATYAVTKKGGSQVVTLEMITNDDVGAVRRIPSGLARSAKRTISSAVWTLVTGNGTIYDGVALCSVATHANTTAAFEAMGLDSITAGRTAMMKQTLPAGVDGTAGERLMVAPKFLCAAVDLERTMFELVFASGQPILNLSSSEAADSQTRPNFLQRLGLEPVVIPHLTDTNDWWLIASPNELPTIEVGFLGGREEPELFVQDLPNVGSLFSSDELTYKIRHIYGVAVTEFRGFYGQLG